MAETGSDFRCIHPRVRAGLKIRKLRDLRPLKKGKISSGLPLASGFVPSPSSKIAQTEFVTNSTSCGGGAVNRLFTFILKPVRLLGADPCLAGLLKIFRDRAFGGKSRIPCTGRIHSALWPNICL